MKEIFGPAGDGRVRYFRPGFSRTFGPRFNEPKASTLLGDVSSRLVLTLSTAYAVGVNFVQQQLSVTVVLARYNMLLACPQLTYNSYVFQMLIYNLHIGLNDVSAQLVQRRSFVI
jgi:hypothetical protein